MGILEKIFGKKELTASEYAIDGEFNLKNGEYKSALKFLNKAIALSPKEDMYYASRSKVKIKLKDYKGAMADIEKALEIQPDVNIYKDIKNQITQFIG